MVDENFSFVGGLEIDWKTLTGGNEAAFLNLVIVWMQVNGQKCDDESIKRSAFAFASRPFVFGRKG